MKLKLLLLALVIFMIACQPRQFEVDDIIKGPETEEMEEPVQAVPEPEPEPQTCEEWVDTLLPEVFGMELPASKDPNSAGWLLVDDSDWTDGTAITLKGDIEFQKGRFEGENTELWYTRNARNERLYGAGGLTYSKQIINEDGSVGMLDFMIKPTFKKIEIITPPPEKQFDPYIGRFTIQDIGFVSCDLS
ncbi:hypothetical protein GOV09_00030 [Candidatus Woesearchaeota archaeon]|nr:hypothetical protein [Candidatus Woesearchaeota archaeon]